MMLVVTASFETMVLMCPCHLCPRRKKFEVVHTLTTQYNTSNAGVGGRIKMVGDLSSQGVLQHFPGLSFRICPR